MSNNKFSYYGIEYPIPENVPAEGREDWIKYRKLEIDWSEMKKTITLSDGREIRLPNINIKGTVKNEPPDIQEKAMALSSELRSHCIKMMHAKNRLKKPSPVVELISDNESTQILELLGRDYSVTEVHRVLLKSNIKVDYNILLKFAKLNEDKIRELRTRWREDINDVSLSIKRSRLEKLNYLLNDLFEHFNKATPNKKLEFSREIRGIIEQARKEVEGEEIKLTVNGRIDIEATISNYMNDSRILQDLTLHQIVISRVATKLGMTSQYLIERLAHSFYSKFNGFRRNSDLSTKILYPSAVNYDILELEQKNKAIVAKQDKFLIEDVKFEKVEAINIKLKKDLLRSKVSMLLKQSEDSRKNLKDEEISMD